MKVRPFSSIEEAVAVLGHHKVRDRLEALEKIGVKLSQHTHEELAEAVHCERETVCRAMTVMGRKRRSFE